MSKFVLESKDKLNRKVVKLLNKYSIEEVLLSIEDECEYRRNGVSDLTEKQQYTYQETFYALQFMRQYKSGSKNSTGI